MIKYLFTIFDEKSGIYSDPFTAVNKNMAERDFTYACTQDTNSALFRYTQDFHLFQLSTYDDQDGTIQPDRHLLLSGTQLIQLKNSLQNSNNNQEQ